MRSPSNPALKRWTLHPWLLLAILAALSLAAVGCGGGSGSGDDPLGALGSEDASPPAAAELLPAGVPILVTVSTELDSDQWQLVNGFADRFPATQGAVDSLLSAMATDGVDFDTEVRPILGADVSLAILDVTATDPAIALLLQPSDPALFEEFLARGQSENPEGPAWRVVDDWYVLADDDPTIDTLLAGAEQSSLADDPHFTEVMSSLPEDGLARMWISPAVTSELASQTAAGAPAGLGSLEGCFGGTGLGSFDGGGLSVLAQEAGVQLVGLTKTAGLPVPATGKAEILELAPADVLAYISLRDLREAVKQIVDCGIQSQPGLEAQLSQAEALLGLTIEEDLLPLFENEHAVYIRPGVPIPEITIVLTPDDSAAGMDLVGRLLAIAELGGDDLALESEELEISGAAARKITIDGQSVFLADVEDHLVITTVPAGIEDFGSSDSLKDDPGFAAARDASGLPDETAGFVYVDIKGVLELATLGGLLGAVGAGDIDPAALENLEPLGTVLAYGTATSDEQRFAALLTIE